MNEKLKKLRKVASKVELAAVEERKEALDRCEKTYKESLTVVNGKSRDYAREMLEQIVNQLAQKYFPEEKVYKTRREAHQWLLVEKYRKPGKSKPISQAMFYADCKKGKCKIEPNGTIKETALEKYIRLAELVRGDDAGREMDEVSQETIKTKAKREKIKLEKEEFDLAVSKGEYTLTKEVNDLLVDRITEFNRAHMSQGRRLALRCANKPAEEIQKIIEADNWSILEAYSRENPITGDIGEKMLKKIKREKRLKN